MPLKFFDHSVDPTADNFKNLSYIVEAVSLELATYCDYKVLFEHLVICDIHTAL